MSMMFLWWIWLVARASAMKRETICGLLDHCRESTFTAAVLPMSGCTAR